MTNILIAITAYFIDRIFGEFKFFRHPVKYIGDMITWFEENYYQDSFIRGVYLVIFIVGSIGFISLLIEEYISYFFSLLNIVTSAFIASMFISHKLLYDSVTKVLTSDYKNEALAKLLREDTKDMSENDIYRITIETYAKRLNTDFIAPIFYLIFFGLPGIITYKAIRTLDSMVGSKTQKYEQYGKAAALLDDLASYIPARITAVLIMLVSSQKDVFSFYENAKKHESPNTGHPLTAMAMALGIKLGAGKIRFGEGREEITQEDVRAALKLGRI